MAGGLHGRGHVGGMHGRRGMAVGMCGRGACMAGGMHGGVGGGGGMHGRRDGHCSGWYASYWNAYLFIAINVHKRRQWKIL